MDVWIRVRFWGERRLPWFTLERSLQLQPGTGGFVYFGGADCEGLCSRCSLSLLDAAGAWPITPRSLGRLRGQKPCRTRAALVAAPVGE